MKGLRQLFSSGQVSVFTLDPDSSQRRGSKVDYTVRIGYDRIVPEDVVMVASLMGLSDVQIGALYFLHRHLGRAWITRLLDEDDPLASGQLTDLLDLLAEAKTLGLDPAPLAAKATEAFEAAENPDDIFSLWPLDREQLQRASEDDVYEVLISTYSIEKARAHYPGRFDVGFGLADLLPFLGDRAWVTIEADVSEICPPGTVSLTFHFAETPTNVLTNAALDPIAKIPETKVCAVRVEK